MRAIRLGAPDPNDAALASRRAVAAVAAQLAGVYAAADAVNQKVVSPRHRAHEPGARTRAPGDTVAHSQSPCLISRRRRRKAETLHSTGARLDRKDAVRPSRF